MDQNFEERKNGKFLPIVSIIIGLLLVGPLLPKYHVGDKAVVGQIIFSIIVAVAFIGWGILSLKKRKGSQENKYLKITTNISRYIIWIVILILLVSIIPYILLLLGR